MVEIIGKLEKTPLPHFLTSTSYTGFFHTSRRHAGIYAYKGIVGGEVSFPPVELVVQNILGGFSRK